MSSPSATSSPIYDLAGLTLEVNDLERAATFYQTLFGLNAVHAPHEHGPAEDSPAEDSSVTLRVSAHQTLTLWQPVTRRPMTPWLAPLFPRGAAHLHYAWQILPEDFEACRRGLNAHGIAFEEIDLGTPERPDPGLYFFDPFGHGLELRTVDLRDARAPHFPPQPRLPGEPGLPVIGLREVALAFADYPAMVERLPDAYGFVLAKEQEDRNFAQFPLGPHAEDDGNGTPRRWLYAWDPQVGLADMMGGDHALVEFYAEVPQVLERVQRAGLPCIQNAGALAVRDPEGHTFVFRPLPS